MKYKCIIVEDEPLAAEIISDYIDQFHELELRAKFRNAKDAMTFLRGEKTDLLFLDIMMPGLDGMILARSLVQPPEIIFTTANKEFAAESYELNALDYLIKPISFDRFSRAIDKFLRRSPEAEVPSRQGTCIFVKADNKTYKILPGDISYIESFKDFIKIHQADGSVITSYQSISNIEKVLPPDKFLRVHRSFIVNYDHIKAFSAGYIEVADNEIPIGRTYRETIAGKLKQE